MRLEGALRIAAPPETVFDLVADERNEPRYNPRIAKAEMVSEGPVGQGSRFVAEPRGGRAGRTMTVDIVEYDRPGRLRIRVRSSSLDTDGTLTFTANDGGTLMRWSWQLRLAGPARALAPVLRVVGPRWERRNWVGLKRFLEHGGGAAPRLIAPGVHRLALGRGAVASNVYFVDSGDGWTLVDTGWAASGEAIRAAAEALHGPGASPVAILLTHIHPDHSGAAGWLARQWQVPVYASAAELPMARGRYLREYSMPLDRWAVVPIMRLLPASVRASIEAAGDISDVTRAFEPGGDVPALPGWRAVPTPGHTPGHVAFHRPEDGVLLSGDAVLTVDLNSVAGVLSGQQRITGPPRYTTWNWRRAQQSIGVLAALRPRVLAAGHGEPVSAGTACALQALARRRRLRRHSPVRRPCSPGRCARSAG